MNKNIEVGQIVKIVNVTSACIPAKYEGAVARVIPGGGLDYDMRQFWRVLVPEDNSTWNVYAEDIEEVNDHPENLKFGDPLWVRGEKRYFVAYDHICSDDGLKYLVTKDIQPTILSLGYYSWEFASDVSFTPPKPERPELEVGQPIWYRYSPCSSWYGGFYIRWSGDGNVIAAPFYDHLENDYDEYDVILWTHWRLPTKQELINAGFSTDKWKYEG